jgi:predicted PhzF superfamily epimerase YddE/YHI9
MSFDLFQVDAFTDKPFGGNPAAVCFCPEERDPIWMQQVAREMNLSETAFLVPQDDGFHLRWFTPAIEVELCGHATLASAHALWESGRLAKHLPARFYTLSGPLTAELRGDWIELDFPARTFAEVVDPPVDLIAALLGDGLAGPPPGVSTPRGTTEDAFEPGSEKPDAAERADKAAHYIGRFRDDYLVQVASEAAVRSAHPDQSLLGSVCRAAILTARAETPPYDFISRYFAPGSGIAEDPVTGAAHCGLTPFWAPRLGKNEMLAYQASARGGIVRVRLDGARVKLQGQAVTILKGSLLTV